MSIGGLSSTISPVVVVDKDGAVGHTDQLVDDRRGRLAALQMLANRADRHLGQQELRPANFVSTDAAKDQPGESREAGLHPLGLRRDPVALRCGPAALNKIVAV